MTDDLMDAAECAWDRGHGLCACAAEDASECLRLRSGEEPDAFSGEECECCCHEPEGLPVLLPRPAGSASGEGTG